MAQDSLGLAKRLMKRRKFSKAIILLESREENYVDNFDYYLNLGLCYLYTGNYGSASSNFKRARKIKMLDIPLLLGQAVLFLRRGDTARAIQYYMEVLEYEPQNKIAQEAMEFIRKDGDYSVICKWVDTGKIEKFFPPVGFPMYKVLKFAIPCIAALLGICFTMMYISNKPVNVYDSTERTSISHLILTSSEKNDLLQKDVSANSYKFYLSSAEIEKSYEKILNFYNSSRDNAAQVEINRLLNSNASLLIKQKCRVIMEYLENPDFSTIKDVPLYKDVVQNPFLYLDCWVNWSGRVSNVLQSENSYECDLLIGYEDLKKVEGVVPVKFAEIPVIQTDKPVQILAKISDDNGKLILEGNAVFQSVKGDLINP